MTFINGLKTRSKAVLAFLLSIIMLASLMIGFNGIAEEAEQITISYDFNGGSFYGRDVWSTTSYEGTYRELNTYINERNLTPPDDHKRFDGWFYDKECTSGNELKEGFVEEDFTLYAKWVDCVIITVTSAMFEIMSEHEYDDRKLKVLPNEQSSFSLDIYDSLSDQKAFAGLYTEENGSGECITDTLYYGQDYSNSYFKFDISTNKDITLYINWSKPIYLFFDANGGTMPTNAPKYQKRGKNVKWVCDDIYLDSITPVKEGYVFKGWATDKEATAGVSLNDVISDKNETIYAVWELETSKQEEPTSQKQEEPTSQKQEEPISQKQEEPTSQKQEEPTSQKQEEPTSQKQEEPTSQKQEEPTEPDKPAEKLNGVLKGPDGKWGYYKNDVLQEKYTGFQKNEYGYWYIVNGYVDFDRNDILRDGENGWWKVEGGKVNFNYTGVAKNKYGWWRVEGGLVNFNAQGIYKNDYGWWKTTDGKVTFKENGVFKNEYGWWKVEDSKVNFKYTGVAKNEYGWWRIEKGKVNFKFTGIAKNEYGTWYINKGKVDFNKNGKVKYYGKVYKVTNGKAKLA